MNFSISNCIFFLVSLIPITFPCAPFNCPKFSNHVTISFDIEPNLSLTFNPTNDRKNEQYKSKKDLKKKLKSILDEVIIQLRKENHVTPNQVTADTSFVEKNSNLLNVTVIDNECLYDCNYEKVYAPAGTYYVENKKLKKRVENGICLNGKIKTEKSIVARTKIVFKVKVSTSDKRVFCINHWNILANRFKKRLVDGKRGKFIGSPTIQKVKNNN